MVFTIKKELNLLLKALSSLISILTIYIYYIIVWSAYQKHYILNSQQLLSRTSNTLILQLPCIFLREKVLFLYFKILAISTVFLVTEQRGKKRKKIPSVPHVTRDTAVGVTALRVKKKNL